MNLTFAVSTILWVYKSYFAGDIQKMRSSTIMTSIYSTVALDQKNLGTDNLMSYNVFFSNQAR
jgi:hypothetical protein